MNYTLEQIEQLKLEDVESIILMRLELEEGEEATEEQLQAEFEAYKAELIEAEEARLAEIARLDALKERFELMPDHGRIQGMGIQNPAKHFIDNVLGAEPEAAEAELSRMEAHYKEVSDKFESESWLRNREAEYAKIDVMLMEAIAEKEAGRPEKMEAYLAIRAQIKLDNPKPE